MSQPGARLVMAGGLLGSVLQHQPASVHLGAGAIPEQGPHPQGVPSVQEEGAQRLAPAAHLHV